MGGRTVSEQEIAAQAVEYFQERGFEVYQEVPFFGAGYVDIVSTLGPITWVVEVKKQMGIEVLAQARRSLPYANCVSVLTPEPKRRSVVGTWAEVLDRAGIGFMVIREPGRIETVKSYLHISEFNPDKYPPASYTFAAQEMYAPFRRKVFPHLRNSLREQHKTYTAAGSAAAKRYTPFKETCDKLKRRVEQEPGVLLGNAIADITHHYANATSAKGCLSALIQAGNVPGIRAEKQGRAVVLFPQEEAN